MANVNTSVGKLPSYVRHTPCVEKLINDCEEVLGSIKKSFIISVHFPTPLSSFRGGNGGFALIFLSKDPLCLDFGGFQT